MRGDKYAGTLPRYQCSLDNTGNLFSLGIMATINQRLEKDNIELLAAEFEREVEFLTEVGDSIGPGSSAVVALIDFDQVDAAMAELEKYEGGRILRHTLSPEVYQKLSDAVED